MACQEAGKPVRECLISKIFTNNFNNGGVEYFSTPLSITTKVRSM
jgi:hypothetical protein